MKKDPMSERLISLSNPMFLEPSGAPHAQEAPDGIGRTASPPAAGL